MEDNLTIIKREFEQLKGQLVITQSWTIERLIAISTDDEDYYYVTYNGKKLTFNSCVGRVIQLKGKIADDDYNSLFSIAKLNDVDYTYKNKKERREYREDITQCFSFDNGSEKLLTEIYWKLN